MALAAITREDLDPFRTLLLKEMHEIIHSETAFSKKMAQDHWDKRIAEDFRRPLAKPPN